jgi:flagellar capping protein FliD
MTEVAKEEVKEAPKTGRNEPCPCGSGKKFKRCCGVGAEPKITPPKSAGGQNPMDPGMFGNLDPQMMTQVAQAVQRLPKGQMHRLQSLMQKAMSGKDVSQEAAEFEQTLPLEFQNLMRTFAMQSAMAAQAQSSASSDAASPAGSEMTVDQAKEVIEKAAAAGKISSQQAEELLQVSAPEGSEAAPQKSGSFWSRFTRKKES